MPYPFSELWFDLLLLLLLIAAVYCITTSSSHGIGRTLRRGSSLAAHFALSPCRCEKRKPRPRWIDRGFPNQRGDRRVTTTNTT